MGGDFGGDLGESVGPVTLRARALEFECEHQGKCNIRAQPKSL